VEIRELQRDGVNAAASLLSRGMCDNPNNVAAFHGDSDGRKMALAPFFRILLGGLLTRGKVLGAFDGGTLVGVCGMAEPGKCRPGFVEKLQILGSLLINAAPAAAGRLAKWSGAWESHDPVRPHWHLGPVAVDGHLQGKGIGRELLTDFCRRMDEVNAVAYLETDKRENVTFYEKFGFTVAGEGQVLEVPNWYMSRPAKEPPPEGQ
jgi:ribosomal protein S18 acetylase RimI-like enzyme